MSGIALLLPTYDLCRHAEEMLNEKKHHVSVIKRTTEDDVVIEARKAIATGVNIVVSRGYQVQLIRQNMNVSIVEITMTAQELGLLVVKAKKIIKREHPSIGLFGWHGMLCDTTYFDQLYDAEIKCYYLDENSILPNLIDVAMNNGMDILIGGDKCVQYANQKGLPALYHASTGESLRVAWENAENMYEMLMQEKQNYAQFSTVLSSSPNGIIKTNEKGIVLIMNRAMEQILRVDVQSVIGICATDLLRLDGDIVNQVLSGKTESYSTFINTGEHSLVVIMEPIVADEMVTGAIISCNSMKRLNWSDEHILKETFFHGYVARETLDGLLKKRPGLKKEIDLARLFAQSSAPILIECASNAEIDSLCQGIHNYSLRANGPYVVANLAGLSEERQKSVLFGNNGEAENDAGQGAISKASYGTLVVKSIGQMAMSLQYHLLKLICKKQIGFCDIENESTRSLNVRIIICSNHTLEDLNSGGTICKELYYLLKTFRLVIPNLSARKNDLEILIDLYTKKYLNTYSRFHILAPGAREILLEYPWEGDVQLEAFCERMILTANKRTITGEYVCFLLEELYREQKAKMEATHIEKENAEESELKRIEQALRKYRGNRRLTAQSLGISKSTLWRRMKKHGLV